MISRVKRYRAVILCTFFFLAVGAGAAAFLDEGQIPNLLDRSTYLSAEDAVWIRPGLKVEITNVTLGADRKAVVTFKLTDGQNQPLDRTGVTTPGTVATNFLIAYIPENASQYVSYATRTQTSPITGVAATQAATDTGGVYTSLGNGMYTYAYRTVLPAGYETGSTHTVGIYATRNLSEFGLSLYVSNVVKHWVPNGNPVTKIREVAVTSSCNQCHDPLALHGTTGRREMEICIMCHTPQSPDPDTGNTTDMKVMTHKIHMGHNLPSVQAGKPYIIIGNQQSVHDYSHVAYPMDMRNCTSCHKDSQQVNNWLLFPTADTCGSCHDDVNFKSGANHPGGPQPNDRYCSTCHWPESEFEYDATIKGAHTVPYESTQLIKPKFEILQLSSTAPGQKLTVKFKITDKDGKAIAPSTLTGTAGRIAFTIAGPTTDYRWYLQEMGQTATSNADGTAQYTFTAAIPATATGTYAFMAEGWVNARLNPGTTKQEDYRDAWDNQLRYFAVTGTTVTPRKEVVDQAACNRCHDKLQLHGNNRNSIQGCLICHNPVTTDTSRRPAAQAPPESIDFKLMIHKIHTGEELARDYTVYGFGNTPHNYNEILYPGDRRNCLGCHKTATYTVPLPAGRTATTTPRDFWTPTLPTSTACLSCHDSVEAAAHAYLNTATFGEACAVCHKETAEAAVSKAHAR